MLVLQVHNVVVALNYAEQLLIRKVKSRDSPASITFQDSSSGAQASAFFRFHLSVHQKTKRFLQLVQFRWKPGFYWGWSPSGIFRNGSTKKIGLDRNEKPAVSSVVKCTLLVREVWGSIPRPIKSTQCRQRLATVATFLRSCVAQALSSGDEPHNSLHALA